jgi:hypothetical protein
MGLSVAGGCPILNRLASRVRLAHVIVRDAQVFAVALRKWNEVGGVPSTLDDPRALSFQALA